MEPGKQGCQGRTEGQGTDRAEVHRNFNYSRILKEFHHLRVKAHLSAVVVRGRLIWLPMPPGRIYHTVVAVNDTFVNTLFLLSASL